MTVTQQPNEKMGFICYYYGLEPSTDDIYISLEEFAKMLEPRIGKEKAEALCGLTIFRVVDEEDN